MDIQEVDKLTAQALAELAGAADMAALEALRVKYIGRNGLLPELMQGLKDVAGGGQAGDGPGAEPLQGGRDGGGGGAQGGAGGGGEGGEGRGVRSVPARALGAAGAAASDLAADRPDDRDFPPDGLHGGGRAGHRDGVLQFRRAEHAGGPSVARHAGHVLSAGRAAAADADRAGAGAVMESRKPPVRIVCPGRCYRRDTTDATHSANFHQIEGLYVDEKVTLADLKGDIDHFARELMGPGVKSGSARISSRSPSRAWRWISRATCAAARAAGCASRAAGSRSWAPAWWIRNVFQLAGYDPEAVTGYAFGMGIERLAMILFGIDDIRLLYENDVRYLAQF